MTAAVSIGDSRESKETEEIVLKSAEIEESEKLTDGFGTRELLKKSREAAKQKFAKTVNVNNSGNNINTNNNNSIDNTASTKNSVKLVLKGVESPAWHGQLIKIKLKRPNKTLTNFSRKANNLTRISSNDSNHSPTAPSPKSLFEYYKAVRREYEDFREIEAIRLQKRLEKLSDFEPNGLQKFEEFEKEIVPWQSDTSTNSCYLCTTEFTLVNRRHHCRLCGRIICGSKADCIEAIPIKLKNFEVKELKSCTKCYRFLFKKKTGSETILSPTEERMIKLYKKIKTLKDQLLETIPRFNEYLLGGSVTEARPFEQWRQDAWALRDTLILYSVHFRSTVQELAEVCEDEGLERPVFKIFANNLRRAGNEFLQKHMFTLQIIDIEAGKDTSVESKCEMVTVTEDGKNSFKMFPKLLNELFKVTNNNGTGELGELVEFYTDEGDVLDDAEELKRAILNQRSVLKEQLRELEGELGRTRDSEDKLVIQRAIEEVKRELKRIN